MCIDKFCLVAILAIACGNICAQTQSVTSAFVYEVKAGPNSGVSDPLLNSAPGYSIGYGFQPRRWLMLEAGFEQIVRPVGGSVCCEFATNANDQLYLVPFGARYVLAPKSSRVRFTLGGGGAYLNHHVGNQVGDQFGFSGWGGQVVASGDYAVLRSGRLRIGVTGRYYIASPKPTMNFGPPGFNPTDHLRFVVIGPSVTFSFH